MIVVLNSGAQVVWDEFQVFVIDYICLSSRTTFEALIASTDDIKALEAVDS